MQADNFNEEDRSRLERLLSHPESAEYLTEALSKAIVSDQKPVVDAVDLKVDQSPEPAQSDAAINITRHFMISGGLLAGVLLLAAAVATPLRDTYTVCFNPAPTPNTSKCLGVKSYSIDQDHIEKLVAHPSLVVIPSKRGNPALAVGLALFGTAFASGSGFIAKQALREKTEAMPIQRTNRRTVWTANKLESDKVIKQRHQDLQHGFTVSDNTNQHALVANDTLNEFSQIQNLIAALEPQERELFFQHLALKEQKAMLQQQAQLQAQQSQSPFAALLGSVSGQQALPDGTPVNDIEQAKVVGQSIIQSMAMSIKSKVLVAPSRAGKTTVLYLYYDAMLSRYPSAQIYVIADKREMVHPRIPANNYAFCDGETFKGDGLSMLNSVYGIYQERARLPESERDAIAQSKPIRLALLDWLSTWAALKVDEKLGKDVNSKLIGLITKGAGCGVSVDIDTHSATVEALGIDAATRESLDFLSIGYCKSGDASADSLTLLPKVINKPLIVPDASDRTRLSADFQKLKGALLRGEFNSSIIFTSIGGYQIGITPHFERKNLGDLTVGEPGEVGRTKEERIGDYVSRASELVQEYLSAREGRKATFKQIRSQRSLAELWKSPTELARLAVEFLLSRKLIELVAEVDPILGTPLTLKEDDFVYRLR